MDIKKTIIEKLVAGMSEEKKAEVKALFADEAVVEAPVEAPAEEPVAMAEATLEDGTTIRYEGDTPAEGARVVLVDEEGGEVPAPDGDHTLESGVTISVSGGVITAVSGEEAQPEAEAEEMAAEDGTAQLEERIKQLENELAGKTTEASEAMAKVTELQEGFNQLTELVGEFMAQPSADEEKPANVKTPEVSVDDFRAAFKADLRELNRRAVKPSGKLAKQFEKFAREESKTDEGEEAKKNKPANENALDRRLAELERKFSQSN